MKDCDYSVITVGPCRVSPACCRCCAVLASPMQEVSRLFTIPADPALLNNRVVGGGWLNIFAGKGGGFSFCEGVRFEIINRGATHFECNGKTVSKIPSQVNSTPPAPTQLRRVFLSQHQQVSLLVHIISPDKQV